MKANSQSYCAVFMNSGRNDINGTFHSRDLHLKDLGPNKKVKLKPKNQFHIQVQNHLKRTTPTVIKKINILWYNGLKRALIALVRPISPRFYEVHAKHFNKIFQTTFAKGAGSHLYPQLDTK